MSIPTTYLETSFFYYFDDKTCYVDIDLFFREIERGAFEPFTSVFTIKEIQKAQPNAREQMLYFIDKYAIKVLPASYEILDLAHTYLDFKIFPKEHIIEAMHVATATVNDIAYFITYNYDYICNIRTIQCIKSLNKSKGYREIEIYPPPEVIDYDLYEDICTFDEMYGWPSFK
jgi:hypothetical protein